MNHIILPFYVAAGSSLKDNADAFDSKLMLNLSRIYYKADAKAKAVVNIFISLIHHNEGSQ